MYSPLSMNKNIATWCMLAVIGALPILSGCASTEEIMRTDADPFEPFNRAMFTFNDKLDKALIKPVAQGYQAIMPEILNEGVTNFFNNLEDLFVIANNLLQLKFHLAAMDSSRFVFNSTFGLAGFFDVATGMGLLALENAWARVDARLLDDLFQWTSALTTAGFQTAALGDWSPTALLLLCFAMICGGAVGFQT